jgi:hypothetical protein
MSKPLTSITEEELDFLLIAQKDKLIRRIDHASPADVQPILSTLNLLEPLWIACNYQYKYRELKERLRNKIATFHKKPNATSKSTD